MRMRDVSQHLNESLNSHNGAEEVSEIVQA